MPNALHPSRKTKTTTAIDRLTLLVGVVQPLMTLPQIYLVYASHNASQVSFIMWTGYNIGSAVFLVYGIRHKLPPLIWTQVIWLLVQTPMMVSVFIF